MLSPPKTTDFCTVEHAGPDAIVRLCGEVDSLNAEELESVLASLARDGVERLVLDFGGVEFIDSSGLRTIVATANRLGEGGRHGVRVVRPSARVRSVFDATGLTHFFHIDHSQSA